ncbi:MAG TPA: hypothetical protein VFS05_07670 [Gemmatimonadaceae bacterium]|nr:hypothetical protein [Gemmatimonadaceae bacterium]
MNWAYVHLLVNHFPVVLSLLGLAAVIIAFITRRRTVWLYALATLVLAAISAPIATKTGEEGEDAAEHTTGVSRRDIHEHEEAAELATYIMIATGLLSAYGWWRLSRAGTDGRLPTWLGAVVAVGALASVGTVARASQLGGHILHGDNTLTSPPVVITPGITTSGDSGAPAPVGRETEGER